MLFTIACTKQTTIPVPVITNTTKTVSKLDYNKFTDKFWNLAATNEFSGTSGNVVPYTGTGITIVFHKSKKLEYSGPNGHVFDYWKMINDSTIGIAGGTDPDTALFHHWSHQYLKMPTDSALIVTYKGSTQIRQYKL